MPTALLNAYNQLDSQSQHSVMDYIDFLLSKMKPSEKNEAPVHNQKILELAGKIDIDEEAILKLREISTL